MSEWLKCAGDIDGSIGWPRYGVRLAPRDPGQSRHVSENIRFHRGILLKPSAAGACFMICAAAIATS
jgi:hypothetical protein